MAKVMEDQKSDQWSDWDILNDQGFQTLQHRVSELEARAPAKTRRLLHWAPKPRCRDR